MATDLDPRDFDVYTGPGLFAIFNYDSQTVVDLYNGGTTTGTKITGWYVVIYKFSL